MILKLIMHLYTWLAEAIGQKIFALKNFKKLVMGL